MPPDRPGDHGRAAARFGGVHRGDGRHFDHPQCRRPAQDQAGSGAGGQGVLHQEDPGCVAVQGYQGDDPGAVEPDRGPGEVVVPGVAGRRSSTRRSTRPATPWSGPSTGSAGTGRWPPGTTNGSSSTRAPSTSRASGSGYANPPTKILGTRPSLAAFLSDTPWSPATKSSGAIQYPGRVLRFFPDTPGRLRRGRQAPSDARSVPDRILSETLYSGGPSRAGSDHANTALSRGRAAMDSSRWR